MNDISCVLFDCDGTLVDSEILCCEAYVMVCKHYGIHFTLEQAIKRFKGVKLYQVFGDVQQQYGLKQDMAVLEAEYRQKVARLFDTRLEPIAGIRPLLDQIAVTMAVVSNGPVSKMQHSLGLTELLPYFGDRLYSGYDIQRWKPDPALVLHAANELNLPVDRCILVEDSAAGTHAGIAAGIPVFYYCADPHNQPIDHPLVTRFEHMSQLPALWHQRGWQLTRTSGG